MPDPRDLWRERIAKLEREKRERMKTRKGGKFRDANVRMPEL